MKTINILLYLAHLLVVEGANEPPLNVGLPPSTRGRHDIARPPKDVSSFLSLADSDAKAPKKLRAFRVSKLRQLSSARVLVGQKSTKSSKLPKKSLSTKSPSNRSTFHSKSTSYPSPKTKIAKNSSKISTRDFEVARVETLDDLMLLQQDNVNEKDEHDSQVFVGLPIPHSPLTSHTCFDDHQFNLDGKSCLSIGTAHEAVRQEYCSIQEVHRACPLACGHCCEDNPDFTFVFTKDCEWLDTTKDEFRERQCFKKVVSEACPLACRLCTSDADKLDCKNDPSFIVKTEEKNCAWILDRPELHHKKCTRSDIQDACPMTCGLCKDKVTVAPTLLPTSVPSFQLISSFDPNLPNPTSHPVSWNGTSESPSSHTPSGADTSADFDIESNPSTSPSVPNNIVSECLDDPLYIAPFGNGDCGCELFRGTDCKNWKDLLSCSQFEEVLNRCPSSCGTCR